MSEIVIENLTKKFGSNTVLDRIDLKISAREYFVLLGPSGSGKTTLLRLIAGLEDMTSGSIFIGGTKVNEMSPRERNVAMVFQNYALYPHLNVYDNISLPLRVRHLSGDSVREKVKEVAETLHIQDLLEKKPKQISGGQQQRVALARALVRDPSVFLLDEPLSNLDAKLRVEARAFLKRLQKELGITTIFVTHDQAEATTMATKIAVLNKGTITQVDDPYQLYTMPNDIFTAGFIGSPAMNLVQGTAKKMGTEWQFTNDDLAVNLGGIKLDAECQVFMGIRPEHIRLAKDGEGLDCTVSNVEPLGSITFVTVNIGKTSLVMQLSGKTDLESGLHVRFVFDNDSILLFGGQDGKRLRTAPSQP
jgi:multiple sugar transport system ATP-binding protein